eukprot:6194751-Pleurochrysis_carterae.AAC.2
MKAKYPNEFKARLADKLHYRYPGVGGESYTDVIMRLQVGSTSTAHNHVNRAQSTNQGEEPYPHRHLTQPTCFPHPRIPSCMLEIVLLRRPTDSFGWQALPLVQSGVGHAPTLTFVASSAVGKRTCKLTHRLVV